jgi:hypothetical protein
MGGPMWEFFGGPQPFRMVLAETNAEGRMEVLGLAEDDSVWHNEQTTPTVYDWTGWSPFGRSQLLWPFGRGERLWSLIESGLGRLGSLFSGGSSPGLGTLAVHYGFGRMAAFGVARDGNAWINRQVSPLRRWAGWQPFGFRPTQGRIGPFGSDPNSSTRPQRPPYGGLREVVVGSGLGHLVLGLGVDDTVWLNRATRPYEPVAWTGWKQLEPGSVFSSLAIGQPDTSTIEIIGVASDSTVWRNEAPSSGAIDQWSGWQPFGAPGDQFRAVTVLGIGLLTFDAEVFGLAPDDTIWRREPGSAAWVQFGTAADRLSTILPITSYSGVAVGVAGTAPDGTAWYADRDIQSGQWGPLQQLGSDRRQLRQFVLTRDAKHLIHAFGTDDDGNVWHQAQTTPTAWP